MASFTIKDILACTGGKLLQGDPAGRVRGICTNSRAVKKGELFVAIVGKKFDAHDFISQAVLGGARAVIVSRSRLKVPSSVAVIKVKDTTAALGNIACFHRQRFTIPVIAITGSAGKTSTKEIIAAVLSRRYRVLKTEGTENNQYGLPQTLLRLNARHQVAVLEVGTNRPGDIRWLSLIARPTIAVMTNIGESHLQLLKTPRKVFEEKFDLVRALPEGGTAVVNADDKYLRAVPALTQRTVVTFSIHARSKVRGQDLRHSAGQWEFRVDQLGRFRVSGVSRAVVYNALAAICCGRILSVRYNDIKKSLQAFEYRASRATVRHSRGVTFIDDTYNANPVSFRFALEALKDSRARGQKVLVCGDMLELGAQARRLHEQIGVLAAKSGVNAVFAIGKWARIMARSAKGTNADIKIFCAADPDQLEQQIKRNIQAGDIVLFKGSRGMHMERFLGSVQSKQ